MDKGISLVMCQSEKGERLIEKLPFHFEKININKALEHNHQLRHPAAIPHDREEFFKKIKEGKKPSFTSNKKLFFTVFYCFFF